MQIRTIRLLQDILRENVVDQPDKVALICENQRLTYTQIDEMSSRLANALLHNGIQPGDRILFYLLNGVELVVGIFAALKAGAVFCVVDYANTLESFYQIADDCQATAIITYDHQAASALQLLANIRSFRFAILAGQRFTASSLHSTTPYILSFQDIQESYPLDLPSTTRIDSDLAYLIYTSGSTGQSKGVLVTHRCILFTIHSGIEYFHLTPQVIHTSPLPLSFSPGINQLFQTLLVGGTLILEKSFAYPVMTIRRMEAEAATSLAAVPTILALLLQLDLSRYNLSRLQSISSIGAALPPSIVRQLRERLPQVAIYSTYGMAEASYSLGLDPGQIDPRPTSVGKPFPGIQAWIIDENEQQLGPGEIGELVMRGGNVRSGYWNIPANQAPRFRPGLLPGELVCHTGDLFRTDEDGYFYFVGRSDEIIKSGAKKVVPREIENVLYSLPGVLEAAAFGVPDSLLGQVIKVCIVPTAQARTSLTTQDILNYCRQKLEEYKIPRQVEIRDSLPKTPSGKIIKADLV